MGVVRTLTGDLKTPLVPGSTYGDLFEHFIILEFIKLNSYFEKRFKFSYFQTDQNHEIDLIIEMPGKKIILVEIKSSKKVDIDEVKSMQKISESFKNPTCFYLSQDKTEKKEGNVRCLHWKTGLKEIFIHPKK